MKISLRKYTTPVVHKMRRRTDLETCEITHLANINILY